MTKSESINSDEMYGCIKMFKKIQPKIFIPQSVTDIENLEVVLEEVRDNHDGRGKELYDLWWSSIVMLSSWVNQENYPGRHIEWFIKTKDGRYLGILRLSSELPATSARDAEIGWTHENKFDQAKINHSTQLQAVIPFRSFGVNCLGGKLITQLAQAKEIVSAYDKRYKDKTVLLTVLSLNPRPCQYSSIPDWKFVGDTKGDKDGNNKRPTFFCPLYTNYKEFLRNEIAEDKLVPSGNLIDIQTAIDRWKSKAIARMKKRMADGTFTTKEEYFDTLYTKGDPGLGFIE
jgi:hypothetical protein